ARMRTVVLLPGSSAAKSAVLRRVKRHQAIVTNRARRGLGRGGLAHLVEAPLALMADGADDDPVAHWIVLIQGEVSGLAAGDDQLAPARFDLMADQRVSLQNR